MQNLDVNKRCNCQRTSWCHKFSRLKYLPNAYYSGYTTQGPSSENQLNCYLGLVWKWTCLIGDGGYFGWLSSSRQYYYTEWRQNWCGIPLCMVWMHCLWLIKKLLLVNGLTGRKSEQRCRKRIGRVRKTPCSCQRRQTQDGTFPVGHTHVVKL